MVIRVPYYESFPTRGNFIDIGTLESYAKAKAFFEQKPVSV